MHCQPVFAEFESIGGSVAEDLFNRGLCLPSGSSLKPAELARVVDAVRFACPSANYERYRASRSIRERAASTTPLAFPQRTSADEPRRISAQSLGEPESLQA
jgi:hypothetical protein